MSDCHWIKVNGVSLRYRLSGSATAPRTLVLIHEMGGSLESWDQLLPAFEHDYQILTFDLRGAGLSEKLRGHLATPTLNDLTQDLAQLLSALNINQPITLAGCAVGARIALSFAAQFPTQVSALIAMAPALDIPAEKHERAHAYIAQLEREGMCIANESLEKMFCAPVGTDLVQSNAYILRHASNDAVSYGALYKMLLTSSLREQLPLITCPTLMLAGEFDGARPATEIADAAALIKNAQYKLIRSGHFMHVQTPELVLKHMQSLFI